MFIDNTLDANKNKTYTVADYTNFGPNNEVYLAPGQAIAFDLKVTHTDLDRIHLALKSVGGTANAEVYGLDADGKKTEVAIGTDGAVAAATDLYYDITDLNNKTVVIKNNGDAILSVTNVKLTYKAAHEDGMEATFFQTSTGGVKLAMFALRRAAAPVVPEEPEKFAVSYASMTMGNSLAMSFAFGKDLAADWTGHYVEIVKEYADGREDAVRTVPMAEWKSADINGVAHYYATFNGIAAKEMTDNVYVTIYNAEGEAVSDTWTDSVRGQAMRNLAKAAISAEEKTMVVDMLNYGAAAQQAFGYNTADLANAQLSEEQKALATQSTTYSDTHTGDENYFASNLMLKSNIQLMFAFRNVTPDMKAVITFTNHYGEAKEITVEGSGFTKSGSFYVVAVEDMVVADSRQDITCTVYDGEEAVATATDSVASYAARKSDTLFEMLMRFSDSAYAYFHGE